jgi:predicted TIM-barrel fold metal-dependent hydrolase
MAEAGLPLLAHTGGENTLQVIEPKYADPEILRLPLECGVTVIAAHCATGSGLFDPEYFPKLTGMFAEHKNLFADTSALNLPLRSHGLRHCLENEHVASRLVHGSDYPVPSSGLWAWLRGLITTDELSESRRLKNPLERDHQLKRAMGFPPEHFTRINTLLRSPE